MRRRWWSGCCPGIAAWGAEWPSRACTPRGSASPGGGRSPRSCSPTFLRADLWMDGAFAWSRASSSAACCSPRPPSCVIERRFRQAAGWCLGRCGALGAGPRALLPVDFGGHGALADARLAVGARLPRDGGVLRRRALGDLSGGRRLGRALNEALPALVVWDAMCTRVTAAPAGSRPTRDCHATDAVLRGVPEDERCRCEPARPSGLLASVLGWLPRGDRRKPS